jgi:hypothetical protein
MLSDDQRPQAEQIFRAHGHEGTLRLARPTGLTRNDERIFVLPGIALGSLPERALELALGHALGSKVRIVAEGPTWPETDRRC